MPPGTSAAAGSSGAVSLGRDLLRREIGIARNREQESYHSAIDMANRSRISHESALQADMATKILKMVDLPTAKMRAEYLLKHPDAYKIGFGVDAVSGTTVSSGAKLLSSLLELGNRRARRGR